MLHSPVQSATFFAKTARRCAHACHERQSRCAVSRGATCFVDHQKTSSLRRGSSATSLGPTLISGSVAVKSYNGFPTEIKRCRHRFKDQVLLIVRVGAQLLVQCPLSLTNGCLTDLAEGLRRSEGHELASPRAARPSSIEDLRHQHHCSVVGVHQRSGKG